MLTHHSNLFRDSFQEGDRDIRDLLNLLRPGGEEGRNKGPVMLRREGVEKKGTNAVVKSTNKRELVLTTECLVVCKTGQRRNKDSIGGQEEGIRHTQTEGGASGGTPEKGDGGPPQLLTSPSEGGVRGVRVEVKQIERLENLMLLDLTKTGMMKHREEEGGGREGGGTGEEVRMDEERRTEG